MLLGSRQAFSVSKHGWNLGKIVHCAEAGGLGFLLIFVAQASTLKPLEHPNLQL